VRIYIAIIGLFALGVARAATLAQAVAFPGLISLPTNFGPEGIAVGNGHTFYVGSLAPSSLGQVLVGDLRTGEVAELVAPTGRPALGMKHDARSNLLFVAGGVSGTGAIYDASSGDQVRLVAFQPPSPPPPAAATTFINDVVVTRQAAYFTDSAAPFLYRVALGPRGEPAEDFEQIPLPANFGTTGSCAGAPGARANGIAASPKGDFLIVDHTSEGRLYRMDSATHTVVPVELIGGDLCNADGLLLDGKTLYVSQNFRNMISVVELSPDYLSGTITGAITEPFASNPTTKVPTTIAEFGGSLYVVTAGFAPPAPDFVVRLSK
jgi:sugar lactone lactonase YvrE